MDMRYEAYCFADPVFYEAPERPEGGREFAATQAPPPPEWRREELGVWVIWRPPGVELPKQGWKIHVSACLDNAETLVEAVRAYCVVHGVTFKFLRGRRVLFAQNSKYAFRPSSGKLATLYPVDESQLQQVLTDLGRLLDGQPGPYILSDLRWDAGPLYVRYGGFARRYCLDGNGERVLAIADPDGRLVPDERRPVFDPPPWAPLPEFLAAAQSSARTAATLDGFPYRIQRALHFSNGGGVYLAEDNRTGTQVVLKEARPYAGWDAHGADAVTRLQREHDILARLAGIAEVPTVHEHLTWWEHHFMAQSFVDGNTLNSRLVERYPLIHPDPDPAEIAAYTDWAVGLLDRIERGLRAIHDRGVVFGDLHPSNLLIDAEGGVTFIDFELATTVQDARPAALAAAGFAAPRGCVGIAADNYAMACLRLYLFMPLIPLLPLDPGKVDELVTAAAVRFTLPAGYITRLRTGLDPLLVAHPTGTGPAPARRLATRLAAGQRDWVALRDSLTCGILASATPDRTDRLFPGDIEQFNQGGLGVAYGAAGVLYALWATGAGRYPDHEQWLLNAARTRRAEPGFYLGDHGVAYVLDLLGHPAAAERLLEQLLHRDPAPGRDLLAGLAGAGLTYLHFAHVTGDHDYLRAAVEAAERLATTPPPAAPASPGKAGPPAGLMRGSTGPALLHLRLFHATDERAYLEHAEAALRADLDRCVLADDGTLQVDEEFRIVPYVATGSAGIGLVLHEFLRHRPDSELRTHLPGIVRAAEAEFVIQPGLFNGRAGLLVLLATLRRTAGDPGHLDRVIDRHLRRLSWHLLPYHEHLAVCGDQLLRLSMDLATGSAGLLLALHSLQGLGPALPFLDTPANRPPPAAVPARAETVAAPVAP